MSIGAHAGSDDRNRCDTAQRVVFLDIDGTILDRGRYIAASTIAAVKRARASGHLVFLSTGRSATEISPAILEIGFDGIVSAGGGFAEVRGHQLVASTMSPAAVDRLVSYFEAEGDDYYLQTETDLFASPGVRERLEQHISAARKLEPPPPSGVVTIPRKRSSTERFFATRLMPRTGVAKAVFLGRDETAFERVFAALTPEFHVITGTIPFFGRGSGEVTPDGVTKGAAIVCVLEHLGIDRAAAIGIGDNGNDMEMLRVCGVGIAMGNASVEIKAVADEVTSEVLDDGIWNAFHRHGLIGTPRRASMPIEVHRPREPHGSNI